MATLAISHATGATPATYNLTSAVGETVTVTITLTNSNGTARDCTGSTVSWCFGRRGTTNLSGYLEAAGAANGVHTMTLAHRDARLLDGSYQHDAWLTDANGNKERLSATSGWTLSRGVGPVEEDALNASTTMPAVLPLQSTIEIAGILDVAGNVTALPSVAACRAYYAAPIVVVATIAQLQGAGADPGASGRLYVSRDGTPVCSPITMTQTAAGVFRGVVGAVEQALLLPGDEVELLACILPTGGVETPCHLKASVTLEASGKPINLLPVVAITSPASLATVAPGTTTVAFTATDSDGVLTTDSFAAFVDDVQVSATFTLSSGSGTGNVVGSVPLVLSSAGSHTVAVRATDALGGQATASRSVVVALPVLTITSPTSGSTVDEGPRAVTATTDLAMPSATVMTVLDGVTTVGTGTLGGGVTTSALTAGAHSLTARIVTAAGAVTSSAVSLTVAAQSPTIEFTSPANGTTTAPASTITGSLRVTHPGGAGEIAEVAVWRTGQSRTTATRVGTSDVWTFSVSTPGTEATYTLNADVTDRGGTVVTASTISVTHSYAVAWTGAYSFGQSYATMSSPSSSTQTLALSASGATTGNQLRVTFPAGVTGANITPPNGYTLDWATAITPVNGGALYGLVPWSEGGAWEVLLQIDIATSTIRASAQWTYDAPDDLVWLARDSVAGATVIGTWASVADPMAGTYGVTRGNVRQAGSGALVIPTAITSTASTVLGWVRTQVTAGSPSVGFFAGSYESDGSTAEVNFGDIELSSSGDVLEMYSGMPAQGLYLSTTNASHWVGTWEDNDNATRIDYAGWNNGGTAVQFPNLSNRWLSLAGLFSSNTFSRRINGMAAGSEALGGTTAQAPEGIIFGSERAGATYRNAELYFSDVAVCPRAMSAAETTAFYRATQGDLSTTSDTTIPCYILGSSYMTTETGQAHRMAYYVIEQGTALGVTISVIDDFANGAQGVSSPSTVSNTNLQSQINRLLLDHRMHRGCLVFVDYMAMVNEQAVYGTSRATARSMIVTQLDRLRAAGCTLVVPQVSSCVLGGTTYGPDARADQLEDWISLRPDCQILYVNAALQADPAANFFDQGTPGQPETYGPHLAEPVGAAITGKRLVARAFAQAAIGIHQGRLGKYARA